MSLEHRLLSKRRLALIVAGLLLLSMLTFRSLRSSRSGPRVDLIEVSGPTMGTYFKVKVFPDDRSRNALEGLRDTIVGVLDNVNAKMSTYQESSELSRFNRSESTAPVEMSAETIEVFLIARKVSDETRGALDVTVGPLVNAWGFGPGTRVDVPDGAEIVRLLRSVGYRKIEIDPERGTVRKTQPEVYCDLSAVAKGYAVDQVARALDDIGLTDYMVEVGGEVRTRGLNSLGEVWRIGIEGPTPNEQTLQRLVPLSGMSLATSGDYRNYREVDGLRMSHTIDPRTGRPLTHALASVSVIHEECAYADAYATALMVLGPEEGPVLAERLGLAALFIIRLGDNAFEVRQTPVFREKYETDAL